MKKRKPLPVYRIVIWHQTDTEGSHNRIFDNGKRLDAMLKRFSKHLQTPKRYWGFTERNLIQVWKDDTLLFPIVITESVQS